MNFSEALSFVVLAGTSICCTQLLPQPSINHVLAGFAYCCTGIAAVLELIKNQLSQSEEMVGKLADFSVITSFIETISFSLLVANLWIAYGFQPYIGYAHILVMFLLKFVASDLFDLSITWSVMLGYGFNELSCIYLGYINGNREAIIGAVTLFVMTVLLGLTQRFHSEVGNYGLAATLAAMLLATQNTAKSM